MHSAMAKRGKKKRHVQKFDYIENERSLRKYIKKQAQVFNFHVAVVILISMFILVILCSDTQILYLPSGWVYKWMVFFVVDFI